MEPLTFPYALWHEWPLARLFEDDLGSRSVTLASGCYADEPVKITKEEASLVRTKWEEKRTGSLPNGGMGAPRGG